MQFCNEHWDKLRALIASAGMGHLVSKSGEELAKRMTKPVSVPDPLIEAHNMIMERSLSQLGLYIMGTNEDCDNKHFCPICEANKNLPAHPETKESCGDWFINSIVPYLKDEYTREGWLNNN